MEKKKIHIHTDCWFFAGCENMIPVILDDDLLNENIEFSLSYRDSGNYISELNERVKKAKFKTFPLNLFPKKRFLNRTEKILMFFIKPFLLIFEM